GDDVRAAVIFEPEPETEDLVFTFPPIHEAGPKLLWVLEAPHGPHNAYWVYRELDASAFPEGTAFIVGNKVTGNYAFQQVGIDRTYRRVGHQLIQSLTPWEKQSLAVFVVVAVSFAVFARKLQTYTLPASVWIGVLMILTIVFHVWRSHNAPVIIDEGAYLQDAFQASTDLLPFRDFLTKGPIYVVLLKIWREITPDVLAGWRLLSALFWAGVVGFSALLARRFGQTASVQVITAALLALLPCVVSASAPLLLQVVSTLFAVVAVLVLLKGSKENRVWLVGLGGLLMTVGYLTRSSTVAVGIAGAVLLLLFSQRRWRDLGAYVAAGIIAMALVSGIALLLMDAAKVSVMLNIEAVTVGRLQTERVGGVEPVIRWVTEASTVLWRAGGWILAGIVWLPLLLLSRIKNDALRWLGIGVWVAILGVSIYHLVDIGYGLPGSLPLVRFTMLAIVFGIPAWWLLQRLQSRAPDTVMQGGWKWAVVCVVWLSALVLLYRGWGMFRPSYIVEFLPPAAILAAVALAQGIPQLFRRPLAQGVLAGLLAASWWQGVNVVLHHPISGTVTPESVQEMTYLLQEHVSAEEEIFTAQPVVTAAAKRRIIRGYSHPGWIRAARVGGIPPELRKIYFAEDEEITRWLERDVRFVVTDERTSEIYFDDFPERQKILSEQFELVDEVPNDLTEEPFRLYRRK
ncbi:MAG: glycosyltransferase family 39 protein, partial [Patescibacteria group bacterium]